VVGSNNTTISFLKGSSYFKKYTNQVKRKKLLLVTGGMCMPLGTYNISHFEMLCISISLSVPHWFCFLVGTCVWFFLIYFFLVLEIESRALCRCSTTELHISLLFIFTFFLTAQGFELRTLLLQGRCSYHLSHFSSPFFVLGNFKIGSLSQTVCLGWL
jgi:hypothetical protein